MKSLHKAALRASGAFLVLLLAPAPLQAADHLDCLLSLRNDSVDTTVFAQFRAGGNIGESLMAQRATEIAACRKQYGWSDSVTETAGRVILGEILVAGVVKDFARLKLPVDRLRVAMNGFLAGLPSETMRKLADGTLEEATITPLLTMLNDTGVVTEAQLTEEVGARIGEYLSAQANVLFYQARFKTL